MKYNVRGMKIFVLEDYAQMSMKAARIVAAQVTIKPQSVLGLATGSTPLKMYEDLIHMYQQGIVDFSEIISFNLDEYYPIEKENEQSYAYYMKHHFFSKINITEGNYHIPEGLIVKSSGHDKALEQLCNNYDQAIIDAGGIDLQVLGIGNNGHIGFNEPDIRFESGTHKVLLDEETILANSRFFKSIDEVPKQAISMGVRNIMHSKKVLLLASGLGKSEILKAMIFGDITPQVPASILQLHNDVTLILDKAAATEILPFLTQYEIGLVR